MGREVRRVPLDFDWPIGKTWDGFVNPHYDNCPTCNGKSTTAGRSRLEDLVSLIMLSGEDARRGRCHPYFTEMPGLYHSDSAVPSDDLAALTAGLAGREPSFMGHDVCDKYSAVKKIIKAAGLPKNWGICPACKGDGMDRAKRRAYSRWKEKAPPAGDGWQMWETTSEGSPISPVCKTPEELARWLVDNKASAMGNSTASYDDWLRMIKAGWAPSMVMTDGKMMSGVEATTARH